MRPHADDGLGEDAVFEAIHGASVCESFTTSLAHAAGQSFKDARPDAGRFAARMEDDANEVALFFGEADEGLGLASHDLDRVGLIGRDLLKSVFEFGGRILGKLAESACLSLK